MSQKDDLEKFLKRATKVGTMAVGFLGWFRQESPSPVIVETPEIDKAIQQSTEVTPQPRYDVYASPNGRYVLTIDELFVNEILHPSPTRRNDYEEWLKKHLFFGSFLDSPNFKQTEDKYGRYLKDPLKEIAARVEEDVQKDFIAIGQRRHSALPASSHIYSDLQEALKISLKAGVPLDYIIFIAALLHDKNEEDPEIKGFENNWLDALFRNDGANLKKYSGLLTEARKKKAEELERRLNGYIPQGVKGAEREDYRKYHTKAVRIVMDATRFTDKNSYAYSLRHDFSRDGGEGLDQTFRRFVVKSADLISNSDETDPIHAEVMQQLRMASKNGRIITGSVDGNEISYVIGEEFTKRFGSLEKDGKSMSAAMRVANSVAGVSGMQYANRTFNSYGIPMVSGKVNEGTHQLMRLAVYAISDLVDAKLRLAQSAIKIYEDDPEIKAIKPLVDKLIERKKRTTFYYRITDPGFIGTWLARDAGGRESIDALDRDTKKRIKNYKDARHLEILLPKFTMVYDKHARRDSRQLATLNSPGDYDPRKHIFSTLDDFNLLMRLLPDHSEMITDYRRPNGSQ